MSVEAEEINFDDFDLSNFSEEVVEETPAAEETPAGEEEEPEPEEAPEASSEEEEEETGEEEEVSEEEEGAEETGEPAEEVEGTLTFAPYAEALFKSNGWQWDEKLMEADDLPSFNKLINKLVEVNVSAASEKVFADEKVKRINELVAKGASVNDAFEALQPDLDYDKLDLTDEAAQEKVVRKYYKATTKFSDQRIEKEIKKLKDLDELETEASEGVDMLKELDAEKDKTLEAQLEKQQEEASQKRAENIEKTKQTILSSEKIAGYKIDTKLANEFNSFLFDSDEEGQSPYQKFVANTPDWNIQAAMIAFKKMSKETVERMNETEATKFLKDKIFGKGGAKKEKNSAPTKPNRVNTGRSNPDAAKKVNYDDFVI